MRANGVTFERERQPLPVLDHLPQLPGMDAKLTHPVCVNRTKGSCDKVLREQVLRLLKGHVERIFEEEARLYRLGYRFLQSAK
jgi:hypothetical protein